MENFKSTWGPMAFFIGMSLIVAFAMTSCSTSPSTINEQPGLDRLMVEECGMFKIIPSKGMAIDTSRMAHPVKWRYAYFKLNADSTRYVMCK